jgi:hypothetical protein
MTVSSYETTYETAPAASEDSMFGTPIYARRVKRQDRNNKIFLGTAAVGVLAAAGALFFATSAANDRDATQAVAAATPLPASRAVPATPVTTPVTPAVQPVLRTAEVQPALRPAATPRTAPAPRTRVAAEVSAPSASDAGTNVSAREYAPVTAEPVAAPEPAPAPAPTITAEPPAADPIPLIAE